jgi:glutamine synthetase
MPKFKLEYIWLDGYEPVGFRASVNQRIQELPEAQRTSRSGALTAARPRQAEGHNSECMSCPSPSIPTAPKRKNGAL